MTPSKETRRAEGRGQPGRNPGEGNRVRTQSRVALPSNLARVNAAARMAVRTRFTALLHHVDIAALERAFRRQRRQASAGIDGVTVAMYAQDLELNLRDLCARIHTGRYRPQPVRRVYIPKADGGQRPLGVPTLEDKIVQGAVAEVLSAIYEVDFLGFSYGFRPGRNPDQALSSLRTAIMSQRVNWVLDADIRSFFDSVDHEWLLRMLAHRIADPRILRLIRQWLEAGILESDEWHETDRGTPQGAGISPLLANIFLHYVLDLWVHQWRRRHARGRVSIVRYADDFVMGFESAGDARRIMADLKERLAKFGLLLHEDKTRLIAVGRLPVKRDQTRLVLMEQQAELRSEEHTSELQSRFDLVCRLLLEKKEFRRAGQCVTRRTTSWCAASDVLSRLSPSCKRGQWLRKLSGLSFERYRRLDAGMCKAFGR